MAWVPSYDLNLMSEPTGVGQLNDTSNDVGVIGESNMDFQLIMGLLPLQEVLLYQVGESSEPIAGQDSSFFPTTEVTKAHYSHRSADDELLGALDGTYCQQVPESSKFHAICQ